MDSISSDLNIRHHFIHALLFFIARGHHPKKENGPYNVVW